MGRSENDIPTAPEHEIPGRELTNAEIMSELRLVSANLASTLHALESIAVNVGGLVALHVTVAQLATTTVRREDFERLAARVGHLERRATDHSELTSSGNGAY